jgi:hypothetical protein
MYLYVELLVEKIVILDFINGEHKLTWNLKVFKYFSEAFTIFIKEFPDARLDKAYLFTTVLNTNGKCYDFTP